MVLILQIYYAPIQTTMTSFLFQFKLGSSTLYSAYSPEAHQQIRRAIDEQKSKVSVQYIIKFGQKQGTSVTHDINLATDEVQVDSNDTPHRLVRQQYDPDFFESIIPQFFASRETVGDDEDPSLLDEALRIEAENVLEEFKGTRVNAILQAAFVYFSELDANGRFADKRRYFCNPPYNTIDSLVYEMVVWLYFHTRQRI